MCKGTCFLKLLCWNADGIRSKIHELLHLVGAINVDIIAISESRLNPNIRISTPGYVTYRQDRHCMTGRGQGVILMIKDNIKHSPIDLPNTQHLEAVGIKVSISGIDYIIVSAYQSPNLPFLTKDLDNILAIGSRVVVMGDLNANHDLWIPGINNAHGRRLFGHMLSNDFQIHASGTPTLIHYRSELTPTNPNLVITQNINNISTIEALNSLSSNHLPLFFTIEGQPSVKPPVTFFQYNKADWKKFRSHLNDKITLNATTFVTTKDIDSSLDTFNQALIEARNVYVPRKILSISKDSKLPWHIQKLIKLRNRLRRDLMTSDDINTKKLIKWNINTLKRPIKSKTTEHLDSVWTNKLNKVDNPSNDIWRVVKSLRNESQVIPPLIKANGSLTCDEADRCEVLADTFVENMKLTYDWHDPDLTPIICNSISSLNDNCSPYQIKLVRPHELVRHIRKLKKRKSPGEDNIHNSILKNLPQKAIVFLTKLMNGCLQLGYFPRIWKTAKVIAIKKPNKDGRMPASYRPISLLSVLAKLFEAVIYSRLLGATEQSIQDEQFGFRSGHSTTHQLVRVTEHIAHHLNLGESTGMFLLDIEKAFDTVWHDGLLHKLMELKIPIGLVKMIQSYLSNRSFKVQIGETFSQAREIPAGVPQGSILGPYLFLLYVRDMPKQPRTELACFADDTASFTSSADEDLVIGRLQYSLNLLKSFFEKWKLKLNEAKTEAIMFSRKRKMPTRTLKIGGQSIPWQSNVKYLGVKFDKKLNWTSHITDLKNKGVAALTGLHPILNRKSSLSSKTKLRIYTTLVRPCITYACPAWNATCLSNHRSLQTIQNKALKIAYNTPFYTNLQKLHDKINLLKLRNFILKLTRKFFINTKHHTNPLISKICQTKIHDLSYIDSYGTYLLPHHYV